MITLYNPLYDFWRLLNILNGTNNIRNVFLLRASKHRGSTIEYFGIRIGAIYFMTKGLWENEREERL